MSTVHRLRLAFSKLGDVRFISHLDLCTAFNRALRRAELPLAYTEGYSPRPRIAFGPPLPLFVEGERELVDVELAEEIPADRVVERMNGVLLPGVRITGGRYVELHGPSIMAAIRRASYRVTRREGTWDMPPERITELLARETIPVEKESKGARKVVDIRPGLLALTPSDGALDVVLEASPTRTVNVLDLLSQLEPGARSSGAARFRVVRTGLELAGPDE